MVVGTIQNGDFQVEGADHPAERQCPLRSFVVRTTIVRTNTVTNIDDGCSDLRNGVVVEVEGNRQRDGSVVATRIEREDDDDDDDEDDDDNASSSQRYVSGCAAGATSDNVGSERPCRNPICLPGSWTSRGSG